MATIDSFSTVNNGDVLEDGWFNQNYNLVSNRVRLVYTGTGFDNGSSHEFSQVTDVYGDYIMITPVVYGSTNSAGSNREVTLQIEIKEIGGSYSTIFNEDVFYHYASSAAGGSTASGGVCSPRIAHQLTSGQKTNGYQIRITSSADQSFDTFTVLTNINTIIEEF